MSRESERFPVLTRNTYLKCERKEEKAETDHYTNIKLVRKHLLAHKFYYFMMIWHAKIKLSAKLFKLTFSQCQKWKTLIS